MLLWERACPAKRPAYQKQMPGTGYARVRGAGWPPGSVGGVADQRLLLGVVRKVGAVSVRRLRPVAGVVVSLVGMDLLMAALVIPGTVLLCSGAKAAVVVATSHRTSANFHLMTCGGKGGVIEP